MPAIETDKKNISMAPSSWIAEAQIAVSPAAGPLTLKFESLINDITIPPITPAISPAYTGTFETSEIPRHSGSATKNTLMLALKSCLRNERR